MVMVLRAWEQGRAPLLVLETLDISVWRCWRCSRSARAGCDGWALRHVWPRQGTEQLIQYEILYY